MRLRYLIKFTAALLLPPLLVALMAIQIYMCRRVFDLRNSYLLENLPVTSQKVWDALSGNIYPYLYHSVLKLESQVETDIVHLNHEIRPSVNSPAKSNGFPISEERWQQESEHIGKHYRDSVLQPGLPSFTVHFLWCVDGYFEMNQYITIMSLLYQFRPDKIVIHYRVKPRSDPHGYWRWLEDLERDIVMLSLKPLKDAKYCSHELSAGVNYSHFPDPYGVFILGDVMITNLTRPDIADFIMKSFSYKEIDSPAQRMEKLNQSQVFIVSETEPFHVSQSPGHVVISCPTETHFNSEQKLNSVHCVSMQSYISPDQLFHMETRFYRFVRTLIYGSSKPIENTLKSSKQIPNIVHVFLEDDNAEVGPLLYLSIKSAYVIGKVDRVFIHCQNHPRGELWDRLVFSDHLEPKFIPTASLTNSNSKAAINSYLLYTLLQHGGIATLGDVIFMKPMSSLPLHTSAIATLQKSQYRQRHRTIDTTILMSSPGSDFIKDVLGMAYQPKPSKVEIGLNEIASHVSEVNPKSVLIDPLLTSHQTCQDQMCMIAGGHDSPDMTYTTRLIWKDRQPKSLTEFLSIEGPTRAHCSSLV